MSDISLVDVSKRFGDVQVIAGLSAEIASGEFVVVIGPSGCGKSTLLRLIAGLEALSDGEVRIDGERMNDVHAKDRNVAMVFQSYALYPHMTVAENMGFSLKMAGASKNEIRTTVESTAASLELEPLLDRFPKQLSGGQRQRVAIGRAIVRRPGVFLFDEPLSNLDAALRAQTRLEIADLHRRIGGTSIYVTHDQVEAMTLADRILVLNGGRVEQVGTPMAVYRRPANLFVAGFIGTPRINMLPAVAVQTPGGLAIRAGEVTMSPPADALPDALLDGQALTLGVRAEAIKLAADDRNADIGGTVRHIERLGESSLLHLESNAGVDIVVRDYGSAELAASDSVAVDIDWSQALLFDSSGSRMPGQQEQPEPT
ncbi:MAG: sn-glycerol-3-phosphate ABC transporter ATP-binding protein UgpC [Pseudomonadota bacterium]